MKLIPVIALATVAVSAAPAAAQAPGLPRTFNVTTIDSASPVVGGAFGWGLYSADLTGDGKHDLLVAQGQTATREEPNKVILYDGATGAHLDTITPPENNPDTADGGYSSPEMAFVYIETMPDIGSCPAGAAADRICANATIGPEDGIPEIVVGSRALRVNATDGSRPPTLDDPRIGRGYVIDGKTRAVLKRIDMPRADRLAFKARSSGVAAFGRTMASPQGMPPCAGPSAENNDAGVGPCPPLTDVRYPPAVRIGDLDGGGKPDLVFTARGFAETGDLLNPDGTLNTPGSAPEGTQCRKRTATLKDPATVTPENPQTKAPTCGAGKVWTYSGERIAGTDPREILDTPLHSIQNPDAQTTGGEFGGGLFRVGDIVGPSNDTTATRAPDGVPDYVIPFRGAEHPLRAPDTNTGLNMGAAYLFSGATGTLMRTLVSPEPQIRSQFSGNFNQGRAVGDLGATGTPDILLPAPMFNSHQNADEGKLWVINGDTFAGGGGEQSWNFAMLTDPEPYIGGNFGGSQTGVGDLVGGPGAPANEVLVGGFRFDNFTEASQNTVPDVNFMNATLNRNLMTIPHPEGRTGDGFGVGITPMGDINRDGFLDFGVSAYFSHVVIGGVPYAGAGRAWIFTSDNSPPPPPPAAAAPQLSGPAAPQAAQAEQKPELRPGTCANRTVGTDKGERIRGTLAGDEIFGFGGNDSISGFQGRDCIDGGTGNDSLYGDDDNDKLVGGHGRDRVAGGDGRDALYGGSSNDRLDGGRGDDMVAGGFASDDLIGGSGSDRLFGESGHDRIVVGGGRNQVDAGSGNDSIEARNGERDRIICGRGRDRVRADRYDRLNGCEIVRIGGKITQRSILPPRALSATAARKAAKAARAKAARAKASRQTASEGATR